MFTNEENLHWVQSLFIGGFKDGHTQRMPLHDGVPRPYWEFPEYPERHISADFSKADIGNITAKSHIYTLCSLDIPGVRVYCKKGMLIEEVIRKLLDCYAECKDSSDD